MRKSRTPAFGLSIPLTEMICSVTQQFGCVLSAPYAYHARAARQQVCHQRSWQNPTMIRRRIWCWRGENGKRNWFTPSRAQDLVGSNPTASTAAPLTHLRRPRKFGALGVNPRSHFAMPKGRGSTPGLAISAQSPTSSHPCQRRPESAAICINQRLICGPERDSLRKRQVCAPIHRVRLAPHIRFPRIRT